MRRFVLSAIVMCVGLLAFAQAGLGQEKKRFDVFVYADASVKTPLNALRSKLTHALIQDTSLIVNDRSDEILAYIRSELEYTESGRVREDQLIKIGQHFGATTLCVVSVTHYAEYNEYFFEGVIVDITSRTIIKHCMYPDGSHLSREEVIRIGNIEKTYHYDNYPKIQDLNPQTQIKVGNELAEQMGLLRVTVQHVSTYTSETVRCRKYVVGDEKDDGIICYIDNSGEHGWILKERGEMSYSSLPYTRYPFGKGWRIPSLEEIKKIYPNRFRLGLNNTYWTSTRSRNTRRYDCYYTLDFNSGNEKSRDCRKICKVLIIKNF